MPIALSFIPAAMSLSCITAAIPTISCITPAIPTISRYVDMISSPDHVGRVDVLDVANRINLCVGVLDRRLHEIADRRQPLVPTMETAATTKT